MRLHGKYHFRSLCFSECGGHRLGSALTLWPSMSVGHLVPHKNELVGTDRQEFVLNYALMNSFTPNEAEATWEGV